MTTARQLRETAEFHGITLVFTHHLIGAGPSRRGWAALVGIRYIWLGATAAEAMESLMELV